MVIAEYIESATASTSQGLLTQMAPLNEGKQLMIYQIAKEVKSWIEGEQPMIF